MWHIDSQQSLGWWNFVLHSIIDGYSRLITSIIQCSINNNLDTAFSLSKQALEIYGLPSRVWTDKGCENTLIWRKMIDLREKFKEAILHHLVYIISGFKAFDEMSRIMFEPVLSYFLSYGSRRLTELF